MTRAEFDTGDVMVRIAYASVNYKDALTARGRAKIARRFPLVAGIDLAGTVESAGLLGPPFFPPAPVFFPPFRPGGGPGGGFVG